MSQRELFDRLRKAMRSISEHPKTAAQMASIFEEFVVSVEEIACDLETMSDDQVGRKLEEIVALSLKADEICHES